MSQFLFIERCYIFYIESDIFIEIIIYLERLFLNIWTQTTNEWASQCFEISSHNDFLHSFLVDIFFVFVLWKNFYLCFIAKCNDLIFPNLSSKLSTCTRGICIYLALGLPQFYLFTCILERTPWLRYWNVALTALS